MIALPALLLGGVLVWWLLRMGWLRRGPTLWATLVFVGVTLIMGPGNPLGLATAILLSTIVISRTENERLAGWGHRIFRLLFTGFATLAVIWLVAGILPFAARSIPAVESAFVRWAGGTDIAEIRTVGDGPDRDAMAFRPSGLSLRADTEVTVIVRNIHEGVPHNLSLYDPRTGERLHRGTIVHGPEDEGRPISVRERFRTPPGGTYDLVCDLHPWMRGTVTVSGSAVGPGTWPGVGDAIRQATTTELRAVFSELGDSPPGYVIGLQYLFSAISVGLGIFLMVLRPRDTVARLLAIGMVGTGAVLNEEAHSAFGVIPWIAPIHDLGFHGISGLAYVAAVLLFPDGRLKPRLEQLPAWRRPLRVAYLVLVSFITMNLMFWMHGGDPSEYIGIFGVLIPAVGLASQIGRFRHADDELERRQSRLLATTLVAALAGSATFGALMVALDAAGATTDVGTLRSFVLHAFPTLFGALPVVLFVILIRFRLWDIDRIINRGFVYGGLAGFIGLAYVGIVLLGSEFVTRGRNDLWLSILATGVVAAGFQPLRDRLGDIANRLVYGQRETPYEVLARFSGRVTQTYAGDDVLPRIARTVAEGTGAASAEVWVRVEDVLVRTAAWPETDADQMPLPMRDRQLPEVPGADVTVGVVHDGELLGALTVASQHDEPITPAGRRLLEDLATQAGIVLRNVRLTEQLRTRLRQLSEQAEELRSSRQRIVAAQDAERRRMERDIHDGAQQHLVALAVKLRLARSIAAQDPERARPLLDELNREIGEALETLRNLARGIYPAVLADQGLVAAVRSAAERSPLDVTVTADAIARYPQEIETAVYFCVLEGLQNAAKYSGAAAVAVSLVERDGDLMFEVRDDGAGFDPATRGRGNGLQNLTDRLAALDGTVAVESSPGAGTTVRGRIPLPVLERAG